MSQTVNRPARISNWRIKAFDRTDQGQEGLVRLEAMVGISRTAIRKRMRGAQESELAKMVFGDKWAKSPTEIQVTAKRALDLGLATDLAEILDCPTVAVRKALLAVHGNTLVGKALAGLGHTEAASAEKSSSATLPASAPVSRRSKPKVLVRQKAVWQVGAIIGGKWQLSGASKRGGFGSAWPAVGPSNARAWVKAPHDIPGAKQAHNREVARLQKVNHPNIVKLLEASPHADDPWLVVADCGDTMKETIAKQKLSLAQVMEWLDPVAHALDYAHSVGLVHQDVNPGNIARDRAGVVRLLDFGTVANLTQTINTLGQGTNRATSAVGWHFGFAAPETLIGKSRKASDQYALCMVGMAALAGRPDGSVRAEQLQAVVGARVAAVLHKATSNSPRDRFPSCTVFVTELYKAMTAVAPKATRR